MIRLKNDFDKIQPLLQSNINNFAFQSIIIRNTPGDIYVDNLESPKLYAVVDLGNFTIHFGGDSQNSTELKSFVDYFKLKFLTDELKARYYDSIKISYTSEAWKDAITECFKEHDFTIRSRVLLKHTLDSLPSFPPSDSSVNIVPMSSDILANNSLTNIDDMRSEVCGMWGSVDAFLSKGFGTCALQDGDLLSWCTSELLGSDHCGIGIETMPHAQKRGLGLSASSEFLKLCKYKGIHPYWDSWKDNIGSVKIAKKLGFQSYVEYDVVLLRY